MPSTFGNIFTFAPPAEPDGSEFFYDLLTGCQNSMECHKKVLELFLNTLKLSSIKYRTGAFQSDPAVPSIGTDADLIQLLTYIPEDIKYPYNQVLYEQWNLAENNANIGAFANYVQTYSEANIPETLQDAVNHVKSIHYAVAYNDLVTGYKQKDWTNAPGVPALPELIVDTLPSGPSLHTDMLKDKLQILQQWISTNDPSLKALTEAHAMADASTILTAVFGPPPNPEINTIHFCELLVSNIQNNGWETLVDKSAKRLFFETVQTAFSTIDFWINNPDTKRLVQAFLTHTPLQWNKNPEISVKAFEIISQIFGSAITPGEGGVSNPAYLAVRNTFNQFADISAATSTFLFARLQDTCLNLQAIVNEDPSTLKAFCNEIDRPVPPTIHYSELDALIEVVGDVLQMIGLTLSPNGPSVRLFPFSIFDDLRSKPNAIRLLGEGTVQKTNDIEVSADASETTGEPPETKPYWRPIVGVFTDEHNGNATFIKFFNFNGASQGCFYFTDPNNPGLVQANEFSDPPQELFFDFISVTVNGSESALNDDVAGVLLGSLYAVPKGAGVSKANFYLAVRSLSKWTRLNGQRHYDAIYETGFDSDGNELPVDPHLIWYVGTGDLNRSDKVDDELCLWKWMASEKLQSQFPELPNLLGLPPARRVSNDVAAASSEEIAGPIKQFFLVENFGTGYFVLTNTPHPKLPARIDEVLQRHAGTSTSIDEQAQGILSLFDFHYYRKIDETKMYKVIKYLPASNKPNSDAGGIALEETGPNDESAIGISPPLSFRLGNNIIFFKNDTAPGNPAGTYLKNKGNPLFRAGRKRLAAGSVMAKLRNDMSIAVKPGTNSSLSATNFANWVLANSRGVLDHWNGLTTNGRGDVPTDQEWCHLLGHGDGGDERLGNFVSGSFHCNTEQLAMESKGRRQVTQRAPKGSFELRSTAYMFNNSQDLLSNNYLRYDGAYQKMVQVYSTLKKQPESAMRTDGAGAVAPFAALMRYKMYHNVPSETSASEEGHSQKKRKVQFKYVKVFDHIFEGQSEFMDQHQFNILKHAAWFALAGMGDLEIWYRQQAAASAEGAADGMNE